MAGQVIRKLEFPLPELAERLRPVMEFFFPPEEVPTLGMGQMVKSAGGKIAKRTLQASPEAPRIAGFQNIGSGSMQLQFSKQGPPVTVEQVKSMFPNRNVSVSKFADSPTSATQNFRLDALDDLGRNSGRVALEIEQDLGFGGSFSDVLGRGATVRPTAPVKRTMEPITDPRRLIPMRRRPQELTRGQRNTVSERGKPFDEQMFPVEADVRVSGSNPTEVFEDTIKGLNPGHALTRAASNFEFADLVELLRHRNLP